ncbi:DUF262 domain-containing protein [Azonexus fungiphilus]|uniref:DUF262 domain-containing protein n=1 Tax=Azonexus fungiphilus TaxID=146940 RepID=UPI00156AA507|nr:DUF262 domain-containing protein [Azonexus fungiphilus]NHC08597.1 DUF262 domain-containing protein [Azonexus fungiphilus]
MNITPRYITVRELTEGYKNDAEEGVSAFSGLLDVRPKYQREFVYKEAQRDAVVESVRKKYPLNVMYWAERADGTFEVMDGQQRTISLCEYVAGNYSIGEMFFHNLTQDQKDLILDYRLTVYVCAGTEGEKLEWFRTINIAGEKLTEQELRNAVYAGEWLTDAKKWFSRTGGPAATLAEDYVRGKAIRQELLETAIGWMDEPTIEAYMGKHQHDTNASELWLRFQSVINWVKVTFPKYRREMKGLDWGTLYKAHGRDRLDPKALEARVAEMMADEDVTAYSDPISPPVMMETVHL